MLTGFVGCRAIAAYVCLGAGFMVGGEVSSGQSLGFSWFVLEG